jgi:hypothetical protein
MPGRRAAPLVLTALLIGLVGGCSATTPRCGCGCGGQADAAAGDWLAPEPWLGSGFNSGPTAPTSPYNPNWHPAALGAAVSQLPEVASGRGWGSPYNASLAPPEDGGPALARGAAAPCLVAVRSQRQDVDEPRLPLPEMPEPPALVRYSEARAAVTGPTLPAPRETGWENSYNTAVSLAADMAKVRQDARLTREQREELAGAYGDLVVELLRQAARHGFHDAGRLCGNPDLRPLEARPDYRQLVQYLDALPR